MLDIKEYSAGGSFTSPCTLYVFFFCVDFVVDESLSKTTTSDFKVGHFSSTISVITKLGSMKYLLL